MNQQVTIEKIKFAAQMRMQSVTQGFSDVELKCYEDDLADNLIWSMKACVFGEKGSRIVIEYPQDWWEALKDRWAPNWFKRRYPVLYTRHDINPQTIYRNLKISLPHERHHIRLDHRRVDRYDMTAAFDERLI